MRTRSTDFETFNFSFVDILATTIGVLVFMMVMALLNVADRVSPEHAKRLVEDLERQSAMLDGEAAQWLAKQKEMEALGERYRFSQDEARRAAAQDLQIQRDAQARLARDKTEQEVAEKALRERLADLERQHDQVKSELTAEAAAPQAKKEVLFRIPKVRETDKIPVLFECDKGRVFSMAFAGNLHETNYEAKAVAPNAAFLSRRPRAKGETYTEAGNPNSTFQQTLRKMQNKKHFAVFFVRPDGFETYYQLRARLWERGFDLNWLPFEANELIIVGISSGPVRGGLFQ